MNAVKTQTKLLTWEDYSRSVKPINTMKTQNTYRGKAKDAYERGYDAGLEHAMYCDLSLEQYTEAYHDDTLGEILGEIVDNYRQYSPFEFTASEFNRARNSETLWEAYDKGEYYGWIDGLVKRFGVIDDTPCFDNADDQSDVAVLDPTRPVNL